MKALFLILSLVLSLTSVVSTSAQTTQGFVGKAVALSITDGVYPFASSGYAVFAGADSGDAYSVIGFLGVDDWSGVYQAGQGSPFRFYHDDLGWIRVSMDYATPASGGYFASLELMPEYTQEGDFVVFDKAAPASMAGVVIDMDDPLGGLLISRFTTSGNTYRLVANQGKGELQSAGTFTYSRVNRSLGKLFLHGGDGDAVAYFALGADNRGLFGAKFPGGAQNVGECVLLSGSTPSDLNVSFSITQPALWDLTGDYSTTQMEEVIDITLAHDAKGQVLGTKHSAYEEGEGTRLESLSSVKARMSGGKSAPKLVGTAKGTIAGSVDHVSITGTESHTFTGTVAPQTKQLLFSLKSKVCVQRKCETATQALVLDLPEGMNGSWNLGLNLSLQGKKYLGTATITTSTGRQFSYTASASKNSKTGTFTVTLRGSGEAKGTAFSLTLVGQEPSISRLTGTLLGQKLMLP